MPTADEENRVDHRRGEGVPHLARLLEVLGQPPEGGLEDAALLAGPDRVDVEPRERARVVFAQRVGQRGAGPDALGHVLDDLAEPGADRQVGQDGQRAVERDAGVDQGGELLREGEQVAGGDARAAADAEGQRAEPGPPVGLLDPDREILVTVQALDDGLRVVRLHDAVDSPSGAVGGLVAEDGHQSRGWREAAHSSESSCVTRRTSSMVVTPAQHLAQPSCRRLVMPAAIARCRSSWPGVLRSVSERISSVMGRNS